MQRQLSEKVSTTTQVLIQNLPKYTANSDIKYYLKSSHAKGLVEWTRISSREVELKFNSHANASHYFWERNFKDQILETPINCYLNVNVQEQFVQKIMISGVTVSNQRSVFEIVKHLGIYRINITEQENCEQWNACLFYASTHQIEEKYLFWAMNYLNQYNVFFYLWKDPQALKYSIALVNYLPHKNKSSSQQALETAYSIVSHLDLKWSTYPTIDAFSIDRQNQEEFVSHPCSIYALISCNTDRKTLNLFDQLKLYLENHEQVPGKLILNNSKGWQINTYTILFTRHIVKKGGISLRKLEGQILQLLRQISKELLFIELEETKHGSTYHAKLVFSSEQAGKEFLAYYGNYLPQLERFYSKYSKIEFEMFVDRDFMIEMEEDLNEQRRKLRIEKDRKEREQQLMRMRMRYYKNQQMYRGYPTGPQFYPFGFQ